MGAPPSSRICAITVRAHCGQGSDKLQAQQPAAREVPAAQAGGGPCGKVLCAYRLYLAGSAQALGQGWMALHQMLAIRPDGDMATGTMPGAQSDYPFTREYIYKNQTTSQATATTTANPRDHRTPCFTNSSPKPPPT